MNSIVIIANEFPYPPTHGGKVDVWRRICALKELGARVCLVAWADPQVTDDAASIDAVRAVVDELILLPFHDGFLHKLRQLRGSLFLPRSVSNRSLTDVRFQSVLLKVKDFAPDIIFLDSVYGYLLAEKLVKSLGIRLYYRSHNIEHLYLKKQFLLARKPRDRIKWFFNSRGMESLEFKAIGLASRFYDISFEDLVFWQQKGFQHGHWLPPVVDIKLALRLSAGNNYSPEYDVGYLGNLFMPNNVNGLVWFLKEVVPAIRSKSPRARIFIAGSKPVQELLDLAKLAGVDVLANPPDIVPVLRNARVLVNPVFGGSGVNVKSVEMLFTPCQLVATPIGLGGLPDQVKKCFFQAEDPQDFANLVLTAINSFGAIDMDERNKARTHFLPEAAGLILQ
ncbi:glycosyltransferase [Rhodoferax ferrireducens]|uniref:glycosyltransferase n=1 Tax=Rhodoferax ferrireducens TaxID=192843 RepID=UPI003BB5FAFD